MYIFLSYSRADLVYAEQIEANLKQAGHQVFFDKHSIKVAEDFNRVIWNEIQKADLFIYLISENSVRKGSYALTELTLAEKKWPNPEQKVLPVLIQSIDFSNLPIYASICNILQPEGNLAARVRIEVYQLGKIHQRKKLARLAIILFSLILTATVILFAYREYIAQGPVIARTKLGQMNVVYDQDSFVDSAFRGDLNAVNLFLAAGMAPDTVDTKGYTALMKAITGGHIEVVKVLSKTNMDLNYQTNDSSELSALVLAAGWQRDEMVQILLHAGAKVDSSAIVNAVKNGNVLILKQFLSDSSILEQTVFDEAFVEAAANVRNEMLPLLLDRISDRAKVVSAALLEVSFRFRADVFDDRNADEKSKMFQYLLDLGADINIQGEEGFTPLIWLLQNKNIKLAKILLHRNVDANMHCTCPFLYDGEVTPLALAIERSFDRSFLRLLIANGADINKAVRNGITPLMLVARSRHKNSLELVKLFVDNGASINGKTDDGKTALHYAVESGGTVILAALLDHGAVIEPDNNLLIIAVDKRKFDMVKKLLQLGVDVNRQDDKGQTALIHAVKWGDTDMVRVLLAAGANISLPDNMERTAKVFANRLKKSREMIELINNAPK